MSETAQKSAKAVITTAAVQGLRMSGDRTPDRTQKATVSVSAEEALLNLDTQDLIRLSFSMFDLFFGRRILFSPLRRRATRRSAIISNCI